MNLKNSMYIGLKIFLLLIMFSPVMAQEESERTGFQFGLDIGGGNVERKALGTKIEETNFYLGFTGGYWLNPKILVGLELSGWLLQASNLNDPAVGEGISQVFLLTRIYPSVDSGFFVKASGGYVSLWNDRPGEDNRKSGEGFTIGGGYDVSMGETWVLTPFATYSHGKAGEVKYDAITLGVGFSVNF